MKHLSLAQRRRLETNLDGYGIPDRAKIIIRQTAEDHDVLPLDLIGPRRFRRVAHARFDAIYRIRQLQGRDGNPLFSTTQIGCFFGCRDHTTVLNAVRRWEQLAAAEREATVQAA